MIELADVYDEQGHLTGQQKTKEQIFKTGDWRLVVHAWVIDTITGKLLVQQRVAKGIFDNLWDVSVGGGVASGEPSADAMVRELYEEIGMVVAPQDLVLVGRYKIPKLIPEKQLMMNDHSDTFLLRTKVDLGNLVLQDSEVAAVKLISLEELENQTTNPKTYRLWVPHSPSYYADVSAAIQGQL